MFYRRQSIFPAFETSGLNINDLTLSAMIIQIPDNIKNLYTPIELSKIDEEFRNTLNDWILDGRENIWKIKHHCCSDLIIKFYSNLIDYFKSDKNRQSFVVDFIERNNNRLDYSTKYRCMVRPTEIDRKEEYTGDTYIVCELQEIPYYN